MNLRVPIIIDLMVNLLPGAGSSDDLDNFHCIFHANLARFGHYGIIAKLTAIIPQRVCFNNPVQDIL